VLSVKRDLIHSQKRPTDIGRLFREGDGSGAILIEGSGSCLRENQFVCKLAHIHCFLSGGGEGYNFALGGAECDKGGASGSSAHSAVDDENIAHARYRQSWRGRSHRCGQADAAVDKSERTIGKGCFFGLVDSEGLSRRAPREGLQL
jgi:hypothetical protein